eukprot:TRINITY_DN9374_c0_g1_i1.p1 TRINITY_DN9374_c0_g1~~TRINITY_DN9374_c0_g1_i1.p1  ORF type:complete len:191 (-),score=41.14 TRINITY_DN9374_c0_g1_i1:312-884(-)
MVKKALKDFHDANHENIAGRVKQATEALHGIQQALQINPMDSTLYEEELKKYIEYRRLLRAESMMYKQKAKISWIKEGNTNTAFFHAQMRKNQMKNSVHTLYKADGTKLAFKQDCIQELLHFHHSILRTSSSSLPIQLCILNSSPKLTQQQCFLLCAPISDKDIELAMWSIPDEKAPGPDGFTTAFFKNA